MPQFSYSAVTKEGANTKGMLEAADRIAAGRLLKEQGLIPLILTEQKAGGFMQRLQTFGTIPLRQKIVFIEDLHIMLRSGISAPRALRIITQQTKNKKFKTILGQMANQVEAGKSMHEIMEKYPKVFSRIFVSMVEVGEMSGNLEKSLKYLGVQLEREADLRSKVKGAMMYPGVILTAMVILGVVLGVFVLPKLTSIFKEFNGTLPLPTRIVLALSDFMSQNAVLVLGGLILLIAAVIFGIRSKPGKRLIHRLSLRLPVFGKIVQKINIARTARIMSSLMHSGVAIIQGLKVTAESLDNTVYRTALMNTAESVRLGKPFTTELEKSERLFPSITVQMLQIGEETGNLEEIMEQLAEHYETEIDATMKNFASIIEPVLLLVIGVAVGFIAVALIMPIYNISQSV